LPLSLVLGTYPPARKIAVDLLDAVLAKILAGNALRVVPV
jgi:hypothetical protein